MLQPAPPQRKTLFRGLLSTYDQVVNLAEQEKLVMGHDIDIDIPDAEHGQVRQPVLHSQATGVSPRICLAAVRTAVRRGASARVVSRSYLCGCDLQEAEAEQIRDAWQDERAPIVVRPFRMLIHTHKHTHRHRPAARGSQYSCVRLLLCAFCRSTSLSVFTTGTGS